MTKTFRVYYSQGPREKNAPDDYIVDHTVAFLSKISISSITCYFSRKICNYFLESSNGFWE